MKTKKNGYVTSIVRDWIGNWKRNNEQVFLFQKRYLPISESCIQARMNPQEDLEKFLKHLKIIEETYDIKFVCKTGYESLNSQLKDITLDDNELLPEVCLGVYQVVCVYIDLESIVKLGKAIEKEDRNEKGN